MKRLLRALAGVVAASSLLPGCGALGAARDVKDAAEGLANAGRDAEALQAKIDRSKTLTFSATYTVKKPGSPDETVVVTQKPPKSSYKQGDTLLVDDGTKLYNCTKADGQDQCLEIGSHVDGGLFAAGAGLGGGFAFAFNPAQFVGAYVAAAIVPGVNASKGTRDVAGLTSDCTKLEFTEGTDKGQRLEGCTSADGVLTYSFATDGSEVILSSFSSSVSDSAFSLPAPPKSQQDLLNDATSTTATSSTSTTSTSTTSTTVDTSTTSTSEAGTTTSSMP